MRNASTSTDVKTTAQFSRWRGLLGPEPEEAGIPHSLELPADPRLPTCKPPAGYRGVVPRRSEPPGQGPCRQGVQEV